jgi:hypothetical protein
MTTAAHKVKAKRQRRPIYLVVARACDVPPNTGVLVPLTKWDQRAMRDRKLGVGTEVRAELKKPRNVLFHRLAHAIGTMMVEQCDEFSGMDAHDALKRLQRECGAFCDELSMTLDLGALGTHVVGIKQPRSMAFDELDESEFQSLVKAIYEHIAAKYWTTMTPEAVEQMVECYEVSH